MNRLIPFEEMTRYLLKPHYKWTPGFNLWWRVGPCVEGDKNNTYPLTLKPS